MRKILVVVALSFLIIASCGGPDSLSEYEKAGKEAYLNENYAKAREYLGKAVNLKSSDRDVLYYLGMSYQREFFLDSALFYLKRADLLHPMDREVNEALYPIAAQLNEWEFAIRAIMVLVQTGDPIEEYRERLADLNIKEGNNIVAFVHARELLKMDSLNPDRYYQLSVLAFKVDSFHVAEDVIDRAIDKFGPSPMFLSSKGMLLTQRGEYTQAEKILRPLLAEDSSTINKYRLANALIDQSARSKKEEAFRLYFDIKDVVGPELKVDSLLHYLDSTLNPGN